jgi:hypothetical protein
MPEIEFGRIGRMKGTLGDFTFMVLCESLDPALRMSKDPCADVIILCGEIPFGGRMQRFGDIGPVAVARDEIEWLE